MPRIKNKYGKKLIILSNEKDTSMMHCIGVDVSKTRLDVDWKGKPVAYENDKASIQKLIGQLKKETKLSLVVCEATGGYEQKFPCLSGCSTIMLRL